MIAYAYQHIIFIANMSPKIEDYIFIFSMNYEVVGFNLKQWRLREKAIFGQLIGTFLTILMEGDTIKFKRKYQVQMQF